MLQASFFLNNTYSLPGIIEKLEYLVDKTKINFDVIGISESRIKKKKVSNKWHKFERLLL